MARRGSPLLRGAAGRAAEGAVHTPPLEVPRTPGPVAGHTQVLQQVPRNPQLVGLHMGAAAGGIQGPEPVGDTRPGGLVAAGGTPG